MVLRHMLPESRLWRRIRAPLAAGCATAALGRLALAPNVHGPISFTLAAAAALLVYAGIGWLLDGRALVRALSIVPIEHVARTGGQDTEARPALAPAIS
jgi:hypothetical protein